MTITEYVSEINKEYKTGRATEHSYRGYLQTLIKSICLDVMVTNEPTRVKCGAPDYIITKTDIPVGYIEAKDVGFDLGSKTYKEQFDRYRKSLNNLIITDYIDFWLYIDGEFIKKIKIAEIVGKEIKPTSENHSEFNNLIKNFCSHIGQTIKSSKKLAEMMASKARMLSEVIEKALTSDEAHQEDSTLKDQMNAFKQILIHDITPKGFADVYAQTISYGMFAARLHDPTLPTFSRQEASELIPKSNPFLRKLFGYIAGPDIDDRIKWIVDGLVEIFLACNVEEILKNYGKSTKMEDPIIHFYETFLAEYDPALRKSRGVWYTPQPVVNFIVRSVDDILKNEFDLSQGLADNSKTTIKLNVQGKHIDQEVHKVQILDPATGTGTFLAEVVKHIHKKFEGQKGIWSNYVETHLLPRLNGFELLMASYAMAHLKLDLLLTETGYKPTKEQRFKIYLTNSLEEHHADTGTLFANWLSAEANEANQIKRDAPVMVVLGNPPYSVSSQNKNEWIQNLIADYKINLNERKINLDDDYIKFIRFGQHFIDKNGEGVLVYITNNSFIDGITHRQMRKHLLESFDKIYIIDLHGFAKLKEVNLVAENDENVFDIQQGVSINIFIKKSKKQTTTKRVIQYFEKYGTREEKYEFLRENTLDKIKWKVIEPVEPYFFFVEKDFSEKESHDKGFKINDLFTDSNSGIKTDRDNLFYDSSKDNLKTRFESLLSNDFDQGFKEKFNVKDSGSYKITSVIKNKTFDKKFIQKSVYRPFDINWIYYDPKIISRPAQKAMLHFDGHKNLGLILGRQGQVIGHMQWNLIFCTDSLTDYNVFYRGGGYVFPLYKYNNLKGQQTINQSDTRIPNLNLDLVKQIADNIKSKFTNEKEQTNNTFSPIDIFDYIYAVLHSPSYREKYKEFLKIDFPRIPLPKDAETFWNLTKLGNQLRQIHLLEPNVLGKCKTKYPIDGSNIVIKIKHLINKVYLNDVQYFDNVPQAVWEFYIGGYQPAQKWLKDRKDKELSFDDIMHYQKIVEAIGETIRLMEEIDKIKIE